jgi:hypothetical protein
VRRETPRTATGSASALLRRDKTVALLIDFLHKKNVSKWCDLVGFGAIKLDLVGFLPRLMRPTSLRLTATGCDLVGFPGPESRVNAKSQRAKDAKKGRVAPAFGFPGLGIGWINLSGELAPTEWPRNSAEGTRTIPIRNRD